MSDNATKLINRRYRVVSQLGAGSYGVVYKAEDTVLQKTVALKMLNLKGTDPKVLVRFQNEAKVTAKLKHSSIVEVFDFTSDENGDYYLVLDFVEGRSLSSLIDENGPMPFHECYPLFIQILDGLAHAHKNGVVHRDLNPNNILVDFSDPEFPLAKIVDFGLARLDNTEQHLTGKGAAIGTPAYMSPEQCRGQEPNARSDIYSFGCLMFSALCGTPPYVGDTTVDVIMSHINKKVPLLTEAEPDVEWIAGLPEIVEKATAREPKDRFQSAQELTAQLRKIANLEAERTAAANLASSELSVEVPRKSSSKFFVISLLVILIASGGIFYLIKETGSFGMSESQLAPVAIDPPSSLSEMGKMRRYENRMYKNIEDSRESKGERPVSAGKPELKYEKDVCYAANCYRDEDLVILHKPRDPIENLIIQKGSGMTGSGFQYLKSLPLKRLELRDGALTDSSLDQIPDSLQWLGSLVVAGNKGIKGTNIGALKRFPKLFDLDLSKTSITNQQIPQLLKLTSLKYLNFSDCIKLEGKTLPVLAKLPHLKSFNISGSTVQLKYLDLEHFDNLGRFSASELTVTKDDIIRFLKGPSLDALHLDNCLITDDAIQPIAGDNRIRDLSLKCCPDLTIKSLQYLSSSNLDELNYSQNPVGEEGIHCLMKMKNLKILKVKDCAVSGNQVRKLLEQGRLAELYLGKHLSQDQVDQLRSSFPKTRIIFDGK